jgi:hypothetical protein
LAIPGFVKIPRGGAKLEMCRFGNSCQPILKGGELRKKLQAAVGQVVVNPPCHRLPRHAFGKTVDKPRHHDGRHSAHAAVLTALVPDVTRAIGFIRGTVVVMRIAEAVDLGRSVGRADTDAAERILQGFEQVFAKPAPCSNGEIGIGRQIAKSVECCNLAMEKVTHEEGSRQSDPAEIFGSLDGFRCAHRIAALCEVIFSHVLAFFRHRSFSAFSDFLIRGAANSKKCRIFSGRMFWPACMR